MFNAFCHLNQLIINVGFSEAGVRGYWFHFILYVVEEVINKNFFFIKMYVLHATHDKI